MKLVIIVITLVGIGLAITCLPGCKDSNAVVEGKVVITSTKAFSKNKASKSPPPVVPGK